MDDLDILGAEYIAGPESLPLWVTTARGIESARDSKQGESGLPVQRVAIARADGSFSRWLDEGNGQLSEGEIPYRSVVAPPGPARPTGGPLPSGVHQPRGELSAAAFLGSVAGIGAGAYLWERHRILGGILGYLIGHPIGGAVGLLMGLEE